MAIADDFSVAVSGDIRYTGTTANHTVIAFHRYLGDLMDDAEASGDDVLDITDATASDRSTDNIVALNAPYNIDDVAAQHLFDGSIIQNNGDEIYDGILVFAPAGTPLQVVQAGAPAYPNFWDTGLNADAGNGISHRFMLKVRTGGTDIDGRRLLGQTRETGFTYSEFPINGTSRGNNVLALVYATDLNNATAEATIRGYTSIVNTNEGYSLIDVDNDTVDEPYYSEWDVDTPTRSINDFYERHKWLHRESTIEESSADTGSDFEVGNATIIGQAQSFANGVNAQFLTRVRFQLKKTGTPTGDIVAEVYAHSGTFGSSSIPTGSTLATSEVLEAADLTTAYKTYELTFLTPFEMVASTQYCITIEHAVIDGSNFVEVEGLASSGTHAGNRSQLVSSTWTPTAGDDLDFEVYASPQQYGLSGEIFRGVTHEIPVDTESGTFVEPELVTWTEASVSSSGQLLATDSVATPTKLWIQLLTGIVPTDGTSISGAGGGGCDVDGSATPRTISAPSVGASTGTAIIGAYGLGIETDDLLDTDKLTDLDGILQEPPNNVTFSVGGLKSGEDRVLVGPLGYDFAYDNEGGGPFSLGETLTFTSPAGTGYLSELVDDGLTGRMKIRLLTGDPPVDDSTISGGTSSATGDVNGAVVPTADPRQLKLLTTLNSDPETEVVCVDNIPTDTPAAGTIRIEMDTGIYRLIAYSSYTSATFQISGTENFVADPATGGASEAGNSVFISYLDLLATGTTESFTGVYSGADRNLFIRARDGGTLGDSLSIKTFETTGVNTTAGGSATAIRTSDE